MADQKKDKVDVRDLKPNKDAKGGARAAALVRPAGKTAPSTSTAK